MAGSWAAGWVASDIVTVGEFKKSIGAIYDTTLSGTAATIDVTSIIGTYAHLLLVVYARGDNASLVTNLNARFNNDSGNNYYREVLTASAATVSAAEVLTTNVAGIGSIPANTARASHFAGYLALIPNYAGTTGKKAIFAYGFDPAEITTTNVALRGNGVFWDSASAINRVTLMPAGGNFQIGTRVTIYGMGA